MSLMIITELGALLVAGGVDSSQGILLTTQFPTSLWLIEWK